VEQDWVTQSEAARRETAAGRPISQSNVQRYLLRNPELPRRHRPDGRLVGLDYASFSAHRASNLFSADQLSRHPRAPRLSAPAAASAAAAPAAASPPASAPAADDPGLRKRRADAERAELQLAELRRDVLPRPAVLAAIEAAALAVTQELDRRRRGLAQRLTGLDDPRALEAQLKTADRELLSLLSRRLTQADSASAQLVAAE
jgi:hypothetical protein